MRDISGHRITRRAALSATVAWGAVSALRTPAFALAPPITRAIPSSGERLPAVGLGTDQFRAADKEAIRAEIRRMQQLGGTVIDTAAAYGDSEALIGEALSEEGIRERMFLATKLTVNEAGSDTRSGVASFERSLQRLRTRRIDLLQVHNLEGVEALMPLLLKWKAAGRIRYIGITTSRVGQHSHMVEYMRAYPLDFVQVDYSLGNRDAAQNVLPAALERRIAVLANVPFGFGTLLRQALQRPLPEWASGLGATGWSQLLLKYVLSHPAVTCVIPGSTRLEHLEDNQLAARGPLPDAQLRARMEREWDAA